MKSLKNYNAIKHKNNYNKLEVSTENQFEQILITFFHNSHTNLCSLTRFLFCNTHKNLFDFFSFVVIYMTNLLLQLVVCRNFYILLNISPSLSLPVCLFI